MPFALLIIGLVLVIAGVRNTQSGTGGLFTLVHGDFTGQNNFIYWFVAIIIVGLLGYVPKLKPLSTSFLVLIILVLFLKKGNASGAGGGFFQQFTNALGNTNTAGSSATPTLAGLQAQQTGLQNQQANLMGQLSQNIAQDEANLSQELNQ